VLAANRDSRAVDVFEVEVFEIVADRNNVLRANVIHRVRSVKNARRRSRDVTAGKHAVYQMPNFTMIHTIILNILKYPKIPELTIVLPAIIKFPSFGETESCSG